MEEFAAGIIPYHYHENEIYILLGLERSNNKWSGFVGGSEPSESIVQTAIREFNEETSLVFNNDIEYFYNSCITKTPVVEKTSTGKNVYLWFINCDKKIFNTNLEQLTVNQSFMEDRHFKEKSKLQWFTINQISRRHNILYRLKNTILKMFK